MSMHDPAMVRAIEETSPGPRAVLAAGHFVEPYGYRVRRKAGTGDWLITFTMEGAGRYRLGDCEHICLGGHLVLLEPGAPHDYSTAEPGRPWRFYWAHFVARPHWLPCLQWPQLVAGLRVLEVEDSGAYQRIERSLRRAVLELAGLDAWRDALAANALEEGLIAAAREHGRSSPPTDPRVSLVLQVLSQRYHEPLTVPALAELVGISPSRLAHLFKETVGQSIIQTILQLRLRQSTRLLEFTTLPVGEIATRVGFDSPFYFSRQFRAHYGLSPSAYRARAEAMREHEAAAGAQEIAEAEIQRGPAGATGAPAGDAEA
jgi:AraC family transcriptional regulator, arabinose operon regulatory protein